MSISEREITTTDDIGQRSHLAVTKPLRVLSGGPDIPARSPEETPSSPPQEVPGNTPQEIPVVNPPEQPSQPPEEVPQQ